MLQAALEAEVEEFVQTYGTILDEAGRRQVVRNGHNPARTLLTGAGALEMKQPRVRDNRSKDERVTFTSSILPPYMPAPLSKRS